MIYCRSASLDVEPVYTFRGHHGPVLCLCVNPSGEMCFSGGLDASIRCWKIPNTSIDPYDSFDPDVLATTLAGLIFPRIQSDYYSGATEGSRRPLLRKCTWHLMLDMHLSRP